MDRRTIHDIAKEMEAHERECVVYRTSTQRSLDNLESRIKRLELLIMTLIITILSAMTGVFLKVL
jgi:uncharacterized coiled-coil DUF342 family protein|tara:strand:+ start:917 stop:1111 length:195 start_codon:yes stop_codon:yes gene_type:complete